MGILKNLFILNITLLTLSSIYLVLTHVDEEIRWDWNSLEKEMEPETLGKTIKKLKPNFHFGTASASHQIEGNSTNNNWWHFEQTPGKIHNGDKSGLSSNNYKLYKSDAALMGKDGLGTNSYRFSLAWEKIQPTKDFVMNQEAIDHYHDLIKELRKNGVEPMITLHHFSQPQWFSDMGAFEKEENIEVFLKYTEFIFNEFMIKDKVKWWCSFNEPENYVGGGYIVGMFPPGRYNLLLGLNVYLNVFKAHVKVYKQQKRIIKEYNEKNPGDELKDYKIGIVKNFAAFDPYTKTNPIEILAAKVGHFFFNEIFYHFFKSGVYSVPFLIHYEDKEAPSTNDYLGVNYYTNMMFKMSAKTFLTNGTPPQYQHLITDFGYALYAEGLYRCLKYYNRFGIPIIITENGIAEEKVTGDVKREWWIKRHLYVVVKALKENIPLEGYYYWSIMDNFEWAEGFKMRFGLYHVDYNTFERTLREGSKVFVKVLKSFNEN